MQQDISAYFGSVGWLVDRSNKQVLGTVWLIRSQIGITCAHLLIPYLENPEVLAVEFPQLGRRFGVKQFHIHGYYDPWLAKRSFNQSPIYPPISMAYDAMNLAALVLSPAPPTLEKTSVEKVNRFLSRTLPEEEHALAGTANNLQITSILQSLLGNRNQGTLTLYEKRNNPIARFYLGDNKVTHIKYLHLINELALYRLLTSHLPGEPEESYQFIFTYDFDPEWARFEPVQKSTAGLLMDAYGRMESYQQLLQEFEGTGIVSHAVPELNLGPLEPDLRPPAACVWNHLRNGLPLKRLLRGCNFDGSVIMGAMKFLKDTLQIKNEPISPPTGLEAIRLEIANECSLTRGTPITAISLDPDTKMPVVESGFILDTFPQRGDGHYVTSLGLPPSAAGTPLFVNGQVVGIHCGLILEGAEAYAEWIHPSLAISAEQVYQCMDLDPLKQTTEILAYTPGVTMERLTGDWPPLDARIGVSSSGLAVPVQAQSGEAQQTGQTGSGDFNPVSGDTQERQSATGGQRPLFADGSSVPQDSGYFKRKKTGFLDSLGFMFKGGKVGIDSVEIMLLRQSLDKDRFERMEFNDVVRQGDLLKIRLRMQANTYVAVLLRRSDETEIRLVYPEPASEEDQVAKGDLIDLPERYSDAASGGRMKIYNGIPIKSSDGLDEVIVLTSTQPLAGRLSQLGVDTVFDTVANNIDQNSGIGTGKFELRRNALNKVDPAQSGDAGNVLGACMVQVQHG